MDLESASDIQFEKITLSRRFLPPYFSQIANNSQSFLDYLPNFSLILFVYTNTSTVPSTSVMSLYNSKNFKQLKTFVYSDKIGAVKKMAYYKTCEYIFLLGDSSTFYMIHKSFKKGRNIRANFSIFDMFNEFQFIASSNELIFCGDSPGISVFQLNTSRKLSKWDKVLDSKTPFSFDKRTFSNLVYMPERHHLASYSRDDQEIWIWDYQTRNILQKIETGRQLQPSKNQRLVLLKPIEEELVYVSQHKIGILTYLDTIQSYYFEDNVYKVTDDGFNRNWSSVDVHCKKSERKAQDELMRVQFLICYKKADDVLLCVQMFELVKTYGGWEGQRYFQMNDFICNFYLIVDRSNTLIVDRRSLNLNHPAYLHHLSELTRELS